MFFFYIIQYASFVPLSIYFTLDVIEMIHYCKCRYQKKEGSRSHFITPYNPSAFADLGTIDYVITDTTALSLDSHLKVLQVYVPGVLYTIQQDDLTEKVLQRSEREFLSPSSLSECSRVHDRISSKKIMELPDETDQHSSREINHRNIRKIKHEETEENEKNSDEESQYLHTVEDGQPKHTDDNSIVISLKEAMRARRDSANSQMNLLTLKTENELDQQLPSTHLATNNLPTSMGLMPDPSNKDKEEGNPKKEGEEIENLRLNGIIASSSKDNVRKKNSKTYLIIHIDTDFVC